MNRLAIRFSFGAAVVLAVVLSCWLAGLLAGCQKPTTSLTIGTTPAVTSTGSQITTAPSSSATTATSPTTVTSTSQAATATATSVTLDLSYQVLAAGKIHKVDLDQDSVPESISYISKDDNSSDLTLNQLTDHLTGEYFLVDWFFLVDLDTRDVNLDVAVQEEGASNDYLVHFFFFDGKKLVKRGVVPGMICDLYSETITTDPFGLGDIQLDGRGNLTTMARGAVLHTWFLYEHWTIGPDRLLKPVPQEYYPMWSYDPETSKELPETAVQLKMDLPLLDKPGAAQPFLTVKSGQDAHLVQTDNREWIQLRTAAGELGWFQLVDSYQVLINDRAYYSDEVFSGLTFAD